MALTLGLISKPAYAEGGNIDLAGKYIQSIVNKKPAPKWDEKIAPQLAKRDAQAAEAQRQAQAAAEAEAARVAAEQAAAQAAINAKVVPSAPAPSGSCVDWMNAAGITDQASAYQIFLAESGCRPLAMNPSGAYGVCQSLPGNKMASAGADWATNPVTQMRWCNSYAISRYGGWANAWAAWQRQRWW